MKSTLAVTFLAAGLLVLAGCQAASPRPAALTGDSAGDARPRTKLVAQRDTRGHVKHRVVALR